MHPGPIKAWTLGANVDGYLLLEHLGQGGMGEVFLVQHPLTGARLALKALADPDPDLMLRFQREVEAQARVDGHPNIVSIHTTGVAAGRAYCVMDLASGGDLGRRLSQRGPCAPREAAELGRDLAAGLEHIHAHGILHRDLKPQNILFSDRGTPQLVDFGLAKVTGADSLTQTGEILGTPGFMSPEQASGDRETVDERSDVYGLGAVLYAALTGRPPFQAGSLVAVLAQVCSDAPVPPSKLASVPPELEALVLRCLEKDPSKRFPTAAALRAALIDHLSDPGGRRAPRDALSVVALLGAALAVVAAAVWARPAGPAPVPPPAKEPEATASVATLTEAPSAPPKPISVEERLAKALEEIGYPAEFPPADLPAELHESWRKARGRAFSSQEFSDTLLRLGHLEYARQWLLLSAQKDGMALGWARLGQTFAIDPSSPDLELAGAFYQQAFNAGSPTGALRLGEVARSAGDLPAAADWFRRGAKSKNNDRVGSREHCAQMLAELALESDAVPAEEAIRVLDRSLSSARRSRNKDAEEIYLVRLLRNLERVDRSEEVEELLRRLANPERVTGYGDRAAAVLAGLLRSGWGDIDADPAEARRVLLSRFPAVKERLTESGALRVLYDIACTDTFYARHEEERNEPRAAECWALVAQHGRASQGYTWATLRHLIELERDGFDVSQALQPDARDRLEAGARAGNPLAQHELKLLDGAAEKKR